LAPETVSTPRRIAVDPDSSTTIFLGTDKGEILRSDDAGGSWKSVHLEALTGVSRTYVNPAASAVSEADTSAF
jgi:photosystem II stability/assembly factor-like uncharacterized protein